MNLRYWIAVLALGLTGVAYAEDQSLTSTEPQGHPTPSARIIGTALRSSDLDRSTAFYTAGLGMKLVARLGGGSSTELVFSFGGPSAAVLLIYRDKQKGKVDHADSFGRIMLQVPDVAGLSARLAAAGYSVTEISNNAAARRKAFWTADPDGYRFEVVEMSGAPG